MNCSSTTAPHNHASRYLLYLVVFLHLPLILYIHRSKISARDLDLATAHAQFSYYHAEATFFLLLTAALVLLRFNFVFSMMLLGTAYYLDVFDWFSWHTQGKAFLFSDLYRALQLLIFYPEFADNLALTLKLKAVFLLLFPPAAILILCRKPISIRLQHITTLSGKLGHTLAAAGLLTLPFLASSTYAKYNAIIFMLSEQLYERRLDNHNITRETIKPVFGHDTATPDNLIPLAPGALKGYNVVLFVIETAPYTFYPDLQQLASRLQHPWLANHNVAFTRHYSTYPSTDRAMFSIASGLYPPMLNDNNWKAAMRYGDSLPKALRQYGYHTYVFSTAPLSFYNDDIMYRNLGFENLMEVEQTKALRMRTEQGYQWDRSGLYAADRTLLDLVQQQLSLHNATHPNHPFMMLIAPQSSHAPFHCPPATAERTYQCQSDQDKIIANAEWQMKLLEDLIVTLERSGTLDNTLLLVTGDHGIRSKHESPLFPNPNLLQDATFHVPFLLAANLLDNSTARPFTGATSHIDIAPTVLDLLGLDSTPFFFHGVSMLTPPSERAIYFIGKGYLPLDGFTVNGQYYMANRSNNLFMASPRLDFNPPQILERGSHIKQITDTHLIRLEAFLRREYDNTR